MFSRANRWRVAVGLVAAFLATALFAQHKTSASPIPSAKTGTVVIVTTASNVDIQVDQFQLRESPGGQWITERPNRFADELYYRIQRDGVTITRAVPFGAIKSIEFTTFVADDAMYPEVRKMLIELRDGGNILWLNSDKSVTITAPDGKNEKWGGAQWISGFVSSGQKEQGNDYVLTGFTGFASINGERGEWNAAPTEIKRINFVGER